MIFLKGERPATVIVSHIIATSSINSHTHDFHAIDRSSCRACCYIHQGKATRLKSNTLAIDIPILQRDRSGSNQNRSLYRMDENVHAITSLPSVLLVNSLKTADEIEADITLRFYEMQITGICESFLLGCRVLIIPFVKSSVCRTARHLNKKRGYWTRSKIHHVRKFSQSSAPHLNEDSGKG